MPPGLPVRREHHDSSVRVLHWRSDLRLSTGEPWQRGPPVLFHDGGRPPVLQRVLHPECIPPESWRHSWEIWKSQWGSGLKLLYYTQSTIFSFHWWLQWRSFAKVFQLRAWTVVLFDLFSVWKKDKNKVGTFPKVLTLNALKHISRWPFSTEVFFFVNFNLNLMFISSILLQVSLTLLLHNFQLIIKIKKKWSLKRKVESCGLIITLLKQYSQGHNASNFHISFPKKSCNSKMTCTQYPRIFMQ